VAKSLEVVDVECAGDDASASGGRHHDGSTVVASGT
jgi:hypothetical protein